LREISVADGNSHFKVSGDFLLDYDGTSIKRYFGTESEVTIPNTIEQLDVGCFSGLQTISNVIFESDSQLSRIERLAFAGCLSLSSICIPPGLRHFHGSALAGSSVREICVADGNCHFKVCGNFLVDFEGTSAKRYFGSEPEVTIPNSITEFDAGCFYACQTISSLIFESESQISRIEQRAFMDCVSLSSICIPSSIERLCGHCFCVCRSLSEVTFETGSHLLCIGLSAFAGCRSLLSICLPSSVEQLGAKAFLECSSLSVVTFEVGSRLSCIELRAFAKCASLSSICIP
jgi:hypothetical protein